MKKILAALILIALTAGYAGADTTVYGGFIPCTSDTGTLCTTPRIVVFPATTTAGPSIRLPHGTAPSSPTNGDVWTTTAGIYVRINGATVGPLVSLGSIVASPEQGDVLYYNGTTWVALNHGTAGQALKSGGHAANPSWGDVSTTQTVPQNKVINLPTTSDVAGNVDRFFAASTLTNAGAWCTGAGATVKLQQCDANVANCADITDAVAITADTYSVFTKNTGAALGTVSLTNGSTLKIVFTAVTADCTTCTVDWQRTIP